MPDCKVAGGEGDKWGFEVIMGSASQQHLPRSVKRLKPFYTSDGSKSEMSRASRVCRGQPLCSIDENQRQQENVLDLKAREEVAFWNTGVLTVQNLRVYTPPFCLLPLSPLHPLSACSH